VPGCLVLAALGALVGGIVGYATNEVALWLLFHPVRRRCLPRLGLCVQGLVPARRRELARRAARLVEGYLSTGRVWRRLEEEMADALRGELLRAARGSLAGLLLGRRLDALAERLAAIAASAASGLVRRVDVARVVEEELARLEPGEVERLFREMAGRELRFVVYSGLVLGGLVGLLQGLLLCLLGLGG